jgi:hypothetical protein
MNLKGQSLYVLVIALVAAVAAAGCGGDDEGKPIPSATATALQSQLDNIQARVDNGSAGACRDILEGSRGPNKPRVQQLIDAMPDSVDSDVRSALQDSFDNLWDLVEQDCQDKADKEESQKQEQPEQQPTETETTPTETTPTETTPTETTPTETTPPSETNGNGGVPGTGNGNGNGNDLGGGASPDGADRGAAE